MSLLASYALFALITTLANFGIQELAIRLYQGFPALWLSLLAGTAVGLVLKYVLFSISRAEIQCMTGKSSSCTPSWAC